jgi:hypothetical protein
MGWELKTGGSWPGSIFLTLQTFMLRYEGNGWDWALQENQWQRKWRHSITIVPAPDFCILVTNSTN